MTRYLPGRRYLWMGIAAVVLAAACGWLGSQFPLVYIAAGLFILTAALLFTIAARPRIEIHEGYLSIGKRVIPWMDIRRVDRATGWVSLLVVRLTLFDDSRLMLVYPGDMDSCDSLLRHLRRLSRDALIDGTPYRQYWGEVLAPGTERKQAPAPRYRILRPEDEADVERLYQRLKTVGHLDKNADEK
jgi:hypothetical protein